MSSTSAASDGPLRLLRHTARRWLAPLLDIKPYVPAFDDRADARIGWFAGRLERVASARADGRFAAEDPPGR